MNAGRNYQKELDKITADIVRNRCGEEKGSEEKRDEGKGGGNGKVSGNGKNAPTLLLHSCCAPCSSYVLEYLRQYFRITVFYYNPNITEEQEYRKRVAEQKRLIAVCNEEILGVADEKKSERITPGNLITVIEGDYEPDCFYQIASGLEQCPEGGERCFACYTLRLRETAKLARAGKYDYFTTTLTISPLKNAVKLNEIGEKLAAEYETIWLPSDFKKKNGYKRSIELSKEYGLYRQDYCGCVYSRVQREREREKREEST